MPGALTVIAGVAAFIEAHSHRPIAGGIEVIEGGRGAFGHALA